MINKICTGPEAMALVKDGDYFVCAGHMNSSMAEELLIELEKRFLETGSPKNLTINSASGVGDIGPVTTKGFQHLAHEGLIERVIVGHYGSNQTIMKMVVENKVESFNVPQGVINHWWKARAAGKDYEITKVGLGTFADPRQEGCKANERTKESGNEIVKLVNILGEEYLAYKAPKINFAVIRATTADELGNLSIEDEACITDTLSVAMATKASGGIVVAQVKNVCKAGAIPSKQVYVPGIFVDKIVVSTDPFNNHRMTMGEFYNAVYGGNFKVPLSAAKPLAMGVQKIIGRRAAMELKLGVALNVGLGMPEGIAAVAGEEGISNDLTFTVEIGAIGGVPAPFSSFGAAINAQAVVESPVIFDLYDGGTNYATFLGAAQVNAEGDVNASCFVDASGRKRMPGCGGFVNLSQGAKNVIFCITLNAGGFRATAEDGKLKILKEGSEKKFVSELLQTTFSGKQAAKKGQHVLYVTERCVFELTENGIMLIEVAEGIDPEKDIFPFMEFKPLVSDNLKIMNPAIFRDEKFGLRDILENK